MATYGLGHKTRAIHANAPHLPLTQRGETLLRLVNGPVVLQSTEEVGVVVGHVGQLGCS